MSDVIVNELIERVKTYQKKNDVDKIIEKEAGFKISEIFKKEGENYFRKLEEKVTLQLLKSQNTIVSLGGGGFINKNIRSWSKSKCLTLTNKTKTNYSNIIFFHVMLFYFLKMQIYILLYFFNNILKYIRII